MYERIVTSPLEIIELSASYQERVEGAQDKLMHD